MSGPEPFDPRREAPPANAPDGPCAFAPEFPSAKSAQSVDKQDRRRTCEIEYLVRHDSTAAGLKAYPLPMLIAVVIAYLAATLVVGAALSTGSSARPTTS